MVKQSIFVCGNEEEVVISTVEGENISLSDVSKIINKELFANQKEIIIKADKIVVDYTIDLNAKNDFKLIARGDIVFQRNVQIINNGIGSIYLKAGIENNNHTGKVIFEDITKKQIINNNGGKVYIYYNPEKSTYQHKYHNPYPYFIHTKDKNSLTSYMLVNDIHDLQDINLFLHGNYALSSNIEASETKNWNQGLGFNPIMHKERNMPFSGNFDGNNYKISNLYINRSADHDVGLFGQISGQEFSPCLIKDLTLNNITVIGNHYVGTLTGDGQYCNVTNINIDGYNLNGKAVVGGIIGTSAFTSLSNSLVENGAIYAEECQGFLVGAAQHTNVLYDQSECLGRCIGYDPHNSFEV